MITLYQFPKGSDFPSISPYCLKLESYLRLTGIPYESKTLFNPGKGPKKRLPFVDLGTGKTMGDSTLIIDHLKRVNGDKLDGRLTPEQRATTIALQRLLENHLGLAMVYFRWQTEDGWERFRAKAFTQMPAPQKFFVPKLARKGTIRKLAAHGMGGHTEAEVLDFAKKDLEALSVFLGQKKFYFGDVPATIDIVSYSFIGNILSTSPDCPLSKLASTYRNLFDHVARMSNLIWKNQGK